MNFNCKLIFSSFRMSVHLTKLILASLIVDFHGWIFESWYVQARVVNSRLWVALGFFSVVNWSLRVDIYHNFRLVFQVGVGEFKVTMSWSLHVDSCEFQIDNLFLWADMVELVFGSRYWGVSNCHLIFLQVGIGEYKVSISQYLQADSWSLQWEVHFCKMIWLSSEMLVLNC